MTVVALPLIALVVMFVVATVYPVNIGLLGFIGAYIVGTTALGLDDEGILETFPSDIVLTIIGVTFFFGAAKQNGTIDLLVNAAVRAVRGRVALIPWVLFAVASMLTALGTFNPAAVALLAPAAMTFAERTRTSPLVMGILVINGAHAGGFSPISVAGVIVRGIVEDAGLPFNPWLLFLSGYGVNLLLSINIVLLNALWRRRHRSRDLAVFASTEDRTLVGVACGAGRAALGSEDIDEPARGGAAARTKPVATDDDPRQPLVETGEVQMTWHRGLTLVLIVALLVLVLGFEQPIGFVAIGAGLVLAVTDVRGQREGLANISWSTVILVAGMITYISMLQELGTIDDLAEGAVAIGAPIVVALVLCYVIGVTSAFASSTALLTAIIPLAIPLLQNSTLPVVGVVSALAISATVVDVSPFSTNGALVLANAQGVDGRVFYRQILLNAAAVVAGAPLLIWGLLVVVPGLV